MPFHHSLPLLRLIATRSCRIHNARSCGISWQRDRLPISAVSQRRRYATTVEEQGAGRSHAILVKAPKPEELDKDVDLDLLDATEARLEITERAAKKLRALTISEGNHSLALRLGVESGGCHGYQYRMDLTDDVSREDYQFSHPTYEPCTIVIDAISLQLLKGSTIDYATELIGSSFRVVENPQAKGSGCGCGVSWEAKF